MVDDQVNSDEAVSEDVKKALEEDEKPAESFDQESMNATEGLIQKLATQLDELKAKQKQLSEMLKGIFDNDETFAKTQAEAKEAAKAFKDRSVQLNESPEVKDLKMKLADLKEDLKMVEESLDIHCLNYYQMTNTMTFPTPDGSEREFMLKARLKPKK